MQLRGLFYAAIVNDPRPTVAEAGALMHIDQIGPITLALAEAYRAHLAEEVKV